MLALLFSSSIALRSASVPAGFNVSEIGGYWPGLAGLTFDEIGIMYVWDREGRVWIVENDVRRPTPLIDLREEVGAWRDHGMLGFALHPNFRQNGYIYLLYVVDHHHLANHGTPAYNPAANEYNRATIGRLTRYTARVSDNFRSVDAASRTVLVGETPGTGFPIISVTHGVGAVIFGSDGTLLASCGDGANLGDSGSDPGSYYTQGLSEGIIRPQENVGSFRSQLVDSLNGKIIRIDPITGNAIPSNPFYDPMAPRSARSRVWALGLRQPFRMTLRPGSGNSDPAAGNPGTIYLGDVGYDAWEELDVVTGPAMNFGWPVYEGYSAGYSANPANQDTPNPLYGIGGCTQRYFTFRDLLKEATLATPSWPNPCNAAQQIPGSVPHFLHARPAIDWKHNTGPARTGIYVGNDAAVINIGAPGSPVTGPQFAGNCSIGGAWYRGTAFPAEYRNNYFHGDLGGEWIRLFAFDSNNMPVSVRNFGSGFGGLTAIAVHPQNGSMYCALVYDGLFKITYGAGVNQPPTAVATPPLSFGPSPLPVQFSATGSLDPEGLPLAYRWNFGDGTTASTLTNPAHVFNAPAGVPTNYLVTLTVTDSGGLTAQATAMVSVNNTPPTVAITSPTNGAKYSLTGDTVHALTANVLDSEQPDDRLRYEWQTILHHNNHEHPEPVDTNHATTTILSPIGCDGNLYFYRIVLTVTDPAGLSGSDEVDVYPNCTNTPPSISPPPNLTTVPNVAAGPVNFGIGDTETPATNLVVSGISSDTMMVPNANILFGGAGSNRTVTLLPAPNQSGSATITITVSDGSLSNTAAFLLTVVPTNAPTYLLSEGFEGPGFENSGWSLVGAPNPDYTNVVLHGLHSLYCSGPQHLERSFPFADSFNLYFRVRWSRWSPYHSFVYWESAAYAMTAALWADFDTIEIQHGAAAAKGTTRLSANTTYHLWVEWTKGTGANGTMKLYLSTDGRKPASPEAALVTGTGRATARIYLGAIETGPNAIIDRLLVDDAPIGNVVDANQPPVISNLPDLTINEDSLTGPINFTVSDPDTDATSLVATAASSHLNLLPDTNIVLGGTGPNRTLTLLPATNQSGTTTITLTVTDGSLSASDSFLLTVTPEPEPPRLTINRSAGVVFLTWPASAGNFILETTDDFRAPSSGTNWTQETSLPVVLEGTNRVTITPFLRQRFYRLRLQ